MSDWTTDTDAEAQYETVIVRSAQTDKQIYPKMTDLFGGSGHSPSRPTSGLVSDDANSPSPSPRRSDRAEERQEEEEEEKRAGGSMDAETTDDQAFLIEDEEQVNIWTKMRHGDRIIFIYCVLF